MGNPAIGRIVHYRFLDIEGGMERPAIIVHTWGATAESAVQLQVFLDCSEDGEHNDAATLNPASNLTWRTSVTQGLEPGEYHFHEDCPFSGAVAS